MCSAENERVLTYEVVEEKRCELFSCSVIYICCTSDIQISNYTTYLTNFNSERHHVVSTPVTIVCFTMLGPGLFSTVVHSAMTLRQFATTDYLLMILTTHFYLVLSAALKPISTNIHFRPSHKRFPAPAIHFFKLTYGASPAA